MAVTNATYANLPFINLLPMAITNIGGDTQVTTIEPYNPNPLYMVFNQVAQQTWGTPGFTYPGSYNVGPYQPNQQAIDDLANQFIQPIHQTQATADLNAAASTIQGTAARLNSALADPNLSSTEQSTIRNHLSALDAVAQKISGFQRTQDAQADAQKAIAIREEANTVSKAAIDYLNSLATAQGTTSKQSTTTVEGQDTTNNSTTVSPTGSNKVDNVNTFAPEYRQFASDFHDAIDGWGTNDEDMEALLDQIDETNVMQVMLAYNKYQSGRDGESFMEAFMWDAASGFLGFGMGSGKKIKYGRAIATALRQKAEELGVYDQCRADFAAIDKEMG